METFISVTVTIAAVALFWIGLELHEIRESIKDRAARATRQRDLINAYYKTAAANIKAQPLSQAERRELWDL